MNRFYAIVLCVFFNSSLHAEIQKLTIKWTSALCKASCMSDLHKSFSRVHGIQKIDLNEEAGMIELLWKPDTTFSFPPINRAMQWVGLSINDIRLTVRGTIEIRGSQDYYIVSIGDRTRFLLLDRVAPVASVQNVEEFNASVRGLSGDIKMKLETAHKNKQILEIEGPLFQPERSPPNPNMLIIDKLKIAEPEKKLKKIDKRAH